jgi:hypothetical protein
MSRGCGGVFAGVEGSGDGTDFRKLSRSEPQFLAGFASLDVMTKKTFGAI